MATALASVRTSVTPPTEMTAQAAVSGSIRSSLPGIFAFHSESVTIGPIPSTSAKQRKAHDIAIQAPRAQHSAVDLAWLSLASPWNNQDATKKRSAADGAVDKIMQLLELQS